MVALARSLDLSPALGTALSTAQSALLQELCSKGLPDVSELVSEILGALVDAPPATLTDGGLIRDGYNPDVDDLRRIARGGKDYIARLQATERERTGIASLKIGYNQVFGYYIEISKANLDKAPAEYHRKQTLANAERFITPELKEYEEKVLGAEGSPQRTGERAILGPARPCRPLDAPSPTDRPCPRAHRRAVFPRRSRRERILHPAPS